MTYAVIAALRSLIEEVERNGADAARLFAYEAEYDAAPHGISVIAPVYNGANEMAELMISLANQSLSRSQFEVIFALNGCTDESRQVVDRFAATSGINTVVIESETASVARARNEALQLARFRHTTFVDHDDHLSRAYLEECVTLSDYRSVVVSNIIKVKNGVITEDYAQKVVAEGFDTSHVHGPEDIALCYRVYTLNAIKTAPTYMLRRIAYDGRLAHSEDVNYWRDLFHMFTPITVKSPTRRDTYFRKVLPHSLSRKDKDYYDKAKPRFHILDRIAQDADAYPCDAPQRKFDAQLKELVLNTLDHLGRG